MQLPFNSVDFFNVFAAYNTAIWPLQVMAYLAALLVLVLFFKRLPYARKAAFFLLAFFWLINGIGYHWLYFSAINKAALLFGALFVLQALLFCWYAWKSDNPTLVVQPVRWTAAVILIAYAMFFYSLIGYALGHQYPRAPVFGVAPCPTVIFTFGVLLAVERLRWYLYLVPLLWALVGSSAAIVLGVREDFGLAAAALVFTGFQVSPKYQVR